MAERTPPGHDGGRYVYNSDGTSRTAYDANGNRLYEESGAQVRRDYETSGGTTERTDPATGETYTYDEQPSDYNSNRPGWDRRRERRAGRQSNRKEEEARRDAQVDFYQGLATDQTAGIDDPWLELAANTPTLDELAGPELDSELAGAKADGGAIAAQQAALQQLGQISQGGRTAAEEAMLQKAQGQTRQNEKAQREAIMQQAALRGMAGAGTTLGSQLQAQQAGANRYSQAQMDAQAMAEQRALQAMQARGQLGGQMRGQSFGEESTRRSAADDFSRWNHTNRTDAHRDQWGMNATTAQGTSQARATQSEQNQSQADRAAGKQTTTEKRYGQASDLITGIV